MGTPLKRIFSAWIERHGSDFASRAGYSLHPRKQDPKGISLISRLFPGIRAKLIGIFVLIKVVPLLLLALFAWQAAKQLGENVTERSTAMADQMLGTIKTVGDTVTLDATRALDDRSSEAIERLTTDTARAVAAFLYDRDKDVLQAARMEPSEQAYRDFLASRKRELFAHGKWKLADDGRHWEPAAPEGADPALAADPKQALADNSKDFRARPPEFLGHKDLRPLYAEISFVGLDGRERVKATSGTLVSPRLADVSKRMQTFAKAENYWGELQKLKPGEIYVSEVIGAYVGSHLIGPYIPEAAKKAGIAYAPEQSAYAGTENPVGRRFRGIVRWATPIAKGGKVVGYVTLALDHDHLRQFTDRILPTAARYTPIIDAIVGNYAFMWDHKGRAIAHPRDYFIPGFNSQGLRETPWMDQSLYEAWQASGKPSYEFLARTPPYLEQSLKKKPAAALVKAGTIALDCRYLNFSPQCQGWNQLTETGGSGSFVIFFSGLWKLTTAASIPYYTGQYAGHPRGFGVVTIGANVDDFHKAATESGVRIAGVIGQKDREFKQERAALVDAIQGGLSHTAWGLTLSTGVMVVIVIFIAIGIANMMTRRITAMTEGIHRFQGGDHGYRLEVKASDEMGELAASYNRMADTLQESFASMSNELRTRRQAEEQLRVAATAFESQEGMLVTDARSVILRVNRAFTDITGYTAEEAVGRTPSLLRSDRQDAAFYAAMWESIRRNGAWQGEIWNRRKSGEVYPELLTVTAVKDDNGTVTHYVGTLIDISERKQTEEKLRRFRAAMDATEDAIFLVDRASMRFIDVNSAACRMLRLTRAEMFALGPDGVLSTPRAELERSYDSVIAGGPGTEPLEVLWKYKDGTQAWVELRRRAQPSAEGWTIVSVGRDITEHKRHEAELRRLNDELEQRVEQRTHALHVTNLELESFSYSVSHDLRAPLRAIDGFSRMIDDDHAGNLDESGRELFRRVSAAAERMGNLIEDLLKLSRISRQKTHMVPVDLSALVQEVAEELQAGEAGRRVEWVVAPQVQVKGDAGLLRVVLQNLVGNAWKYSSKRDTARIEFGIAQEDGHAVYFVRDNGAGFDMAYEEKLFGAFQRLHSPVEFPGNGIGLATVRRIIHRHGGEIWAEGKLNEGACFYFSLGRLRGRPTAESGAEVADTESPARHLRRA